MKRLRYRIVGAVLGVVVVLAAGATIAWQQRLLIEALELIPAPSPAPRSDALRVTWLGASTLLVDDGDTQLLIDPYFSRQPLHRILLGLPVGSNVPLVNDIIVRYRLDRVAAIIATHSHFDHVLDLAAIANRTEAVVFGSPSAARIARGDGVPEDQISVVTEETRRNFGPYEVTLKPAKHGPVGLRGGVPFDGPIPESLASPAPIGDYRAGIVFDVVIRHPKGTLLVVPSAGFIPGTLTGADADVVFLGLGRLEAAGEEYTTEYWTEVVTASGASTVIPIHFDDYTRELGDVQLPSTALDNIGESMRRLRRNRDLYDPDVRIWLPVFGQPIDVFSEDDPET